MLLWELTPSPYRSPTRGSRVDQRVPFLAVNDRVDTGDLVLVGDAESDRLLDREADGVRHDERVHEHAQSRDHLNCEKSGVSSDEQPLLGGEEAEVDSAEQTPDE